MFYRVALIFFFSSFLGVSIEAQSFIFGPKGGLTLGTQMWNSFDRDVLLAYHGGLFIESYREDSNSSFLAYAGYNKRGSAERVTFFNITGGSSVSTQTFEFNNASLLLAAKKRLNTYGINKPYYIVGVRLEYTINTNLSEYEIYGGYFPLDPFVNKFNYGAYGGFGYELQFSEFVGGFIEASISPDFSKQYEQPELFNIISPITGRARNVPSQTIRNLTFEVSIGLRLLRKVEFID